jgi:hypothetical protein
VRQTEADEGKRSELLSSQEREELAVSRAPSGVASPRWGRSGIYLPKYLFDKNRSINAMAESFVDTFKTELVADRSWRSRSRLELAVVEYVSWFNHERLHESLGDLPPAEFEDLYVRQGVQMSNLS